MPYRKFQAEKIFDGNAFREGQVLVTTDDGVVEGLVPAGEAGDDVQVLPGILSPGFINCHCHLELSHMKGRIPERTGLVDFVFKIVTERHHPEEEILDAIAAAEDEMFQSGVVAVGDICNNVLTIPQKLERRLAYYNFIEASGWLPSVLQPRFERARGIYEEYLAAGAQLTSEHCAIVPHAPYSVSEGLWSAIQPWFKERVASIHNQETAFEDEFFLEGTGDFTRMYQLMQIDNSHHQPTRRSSLQSYFGRMSGAANVLLVHNTFTSQQDLDFIRNTGDFANTYFCLCINANQYIENALPPIELLRRSGCNIVLGTDSLASNHQLSIACEIQTIRKHFPGIPLEELLGWATLNGARALRMADTLGSFEKGKNPGLVVFDENLSFIERLKL